MADEIIKKQITKEGYDELQNELSERKTSKRSEISKQSSSLLKLLTIPTFPQIRFLSVQR